MFKCLSALIWSRKEILLANKQTAVMLLMPAGFIALYSFMFKDMPNSHDMIFGMVLPMISAMIGYVLPTLIAEEAEKNNQRTLMLSGVKVWEYVIASLVIPFATVVVYLVALPFALNIDLSNWVNYLAVSILTSLVTILLYLAVALVCDTQARATISAMPVMMATMLLPMMAMMNEDMGKWITYTHMGAYTKWNLQGAEYSLSDKSFWFLILWLVVSVVLVFYFAKKKHLKK
ncbi:ABC transporter permease [Streptococcus sp. S784/96/1]|uniref:ABC transporter permease n=1 Tax=Streptococcus sp. S784/96/1 TaxID=2653499 RepID=UPI00138A0495|nr:ABC transporter permease [Streptococcus sp. S784/96/1]